MIEGFAPVAHTHEGVTISGVVGGSGPPVLLLHGYPQTRRMWHAVAPTLARTHTVVACDLRGYGDSDKPAPAADQSTYSKRTMAADQHAVMRSLGFDRYAVVGHDRGARVAHRLALDEPTAVERIAVLDIVPTLHMFEHVDRAMASTYFHWFFLALGNGLPERLISGDPGAWLRSRFDGRSHSPWSLEPASYAEYERCFTSPGAIEASVADYRAAATIDLEHDRADHAAGTRIAAPLLALWGAHSYVGRNFDVAGIWRDYAGEVSAAAIESDHYLAEESPQQVLGALTAFLDDGFGA
ncbi:alpha/beta fold hydrolase [Microbacterium sp. NPDC058342]|uniref:alpha/beta fold hydrolase n=1 Tax=Microbacterium sp. NPDC058342 TaxID=3346454 RepID=UPI00365787A3